MLTMAMQLTMESGPIDAITRDAKYTLMEDRLLKRWESTKPGGTGVQVEAKSLVSVIVFVFETYNARSYFIDLTVFLLMKPVLYNPSCLRYSIMTAYDN